MCYLTLEEERNAVEQTVNYLCHLGTPFSGHDVAMMNLSLNPKHVSSDVRALFNRGHECFEGWACMKVRLGAGVEFLAYFKPGRNANVSKWVRSLTGKPADDTGE